MGFATPKPMSLFEHWVADCAVKHHKCIGVAKLAGANSTPQTEAEVTRQSVALIEKIHTLATLVREYGVDEVFATPPAPLTAEQKKAAQL